MRRFVGLVTIAIFSSRCASIVHGSHQQIPITSQPPGARVEVACSNGSFNSPPTPAEITLKRNRANCTVYVSKDGYQNLSFSLSREVSGWYLANILIGGVIGLIVDAADGAMFNQSCGACPDHHKIEAHLIPLAAAGLQDANVPPTIRAMHNSGLLVKIDVPNRRAYVKGEAWGKIDPDRQNTYGVELARFCAEKDGGAISIQIVDDVTGELLRGVRVQGE